MLAQQTTPTPVFIKIAPNKWQFKGFFKAANSHVSGLDFERLVALSDRSLFDVSRVIEMLPA